MRPTRLLTFPVMAAITLLSCLSCGDLLRTGADEVLLADEVYRNKEDADAAIRGIYGQLMDVATQYVVLNELRADLMDVTNNAGLSLMELSWHMPVSHNNEWASPRRFFSLINNCNDVLENFRIMYKENRLTREQYNMRYSDIVAVRSWVYLQMALHFADATRGGVPWITKPLGDTGEASAETLAGFQYLDLPVLVDSLLATMESIPFKDHYSDGGLITTIDGYESRLMYIDKEYLLGELNLWKGNYLRAAQYFKNIMERGQSGNDQYDLYKMVYDASATLDQTSCRFNSGYLRYYGNDRQSAKNMWPYMFYETQTANYLYEWIWVLYFDPLSEPNSFIGLFAKDGGSYLLKPSALAMEKWDSQVQNNSFRGDFRGYYDNLYGLPGSYVVENGDPVILKHIYNHYIDGHTTITQRAGKWHLWRAGGLHLRYSEAANRNGQHRVAYAIMNNGIGANYPGADPDAPANDFTLRSQTLLPFPYDFDARTTSLAQLPPNLRMPWHRNTGVRNRVSLQRNSVEGDSLTVIENQILEECALELAFEGQRWGDLVRIALRRNDPAVLADAIAAKLNRAGHDGEGVRTRLMDRKNWFLPLE
ncbi:MAG TPA: RagB/SusD family nutrient uptake outer membrane protein [Prolixibacteraceae bacterium]|nr:RagB/SusD family nutrient uptake outer membrane protein [Bacteroidales bacterium]HNZ70182.1 RagB/SusD family nutrient uptake outer membrane protein [Prolixibacteraceae bacterium]HOC86972.1 RagB/SusD family nutrient uptake outer membrane protein [Prolixibacteraceae bacterium]HOG95606.1 RagB/SusD family nutrient uptake outer membrane protein [Prolixibacteraceae bacterium]HOY92257.1 RagB/SusD family nutrient uptake outer membrane protein [Prolixibacteraceae bacterium]